MRSFIASALVIAAILIGQQWVTRASEAQSAFVPGQATQSDLAIGATRWLANLR